ncbi:MAG: hypothetical protein IJW04_04730 [Ruminococcus sp.]|nr:hypothetical protein [Ruminococcus sp.]
MNQFLLTLLNMSVVSSLLILAVVVLRLVFKKAPKAIFCFLWALVGLRLICPFSVESTLSLVPQKEPVTYIAEQAEKYSNIAEPARINSNTVSYNTPEASVTVTTQASADYDFWSLASKALPYVWAGGVFAMALSSVISYIKLRKSMLACICKNDNVYLCDGIKSPFILGVIKPKVYIPSHLNEEEQRVVIAHEKAHLKRLDHLCKPLGFVILAIHWFNPLVWLSYALLCRDIEGACDEYVVKKMTGEDKKLYSYTLLSCSAPRHMLTACPVAFGEVSVKARVKSVLNYKKPAFWIIITAVVASIAVAVLFMTNPVEKKTEVFKTPEELIHQVIMEEEKFLDPMYPGKDSFACESHYIFDVEELGNTKAYYLWVAYMEYALEDGQLMEGDGGVGPKVITMTKAQDGSGGYELKEYWEPVDGNGYGDSIKAKFPTHLHNRVLHGTTQDCVLEETQKLAAEHFGIETPTADPEQYPRFTGEILKVTDEYYLIAPTEGEIIMGQSIDKIYVYHGGEDNFIEGELVTVYYNKIMDDTNPPILGSINGISLIIENFRRDPPASVDFYRIITDSGEKKASAGVDVTEDELKNIEVYRYTPEGSWPEADMVTDGTTKVYNERFSPYVLIDNNTGYASFVYSDGSYITGAFSKTDDALTIAYYDYASYINGNGRSKLVFDVTGEGYAFNKKASDFLETNLFEIDGKYTDKLPKDAVFKNDYDLEVKLYYN